MFQTEVEEEKLFEALRHLKYYKHEVVLFHLLDKELELNFEFDNLPKRFVDVETGNHVDLYADTIKEAYEDKVRTYLDSLKLKCMQYKIKHVGVDVRSSFTKVFNTFMVERQKFVWAKIILPKRKRQCIFARASWEAYEQDLNPAVVGVVKR